MKIATFNVNGVNSRLPRLLEWLAESRPDVACLQELKSPDMSFPAAAIREAGYGVVFHGQRSWNGVAILARGSEPIETGRGLYGNSEDSQSRYIEAVVNGVIVGCLYLPNGNPQPGPKFDYKLEWFERLNAHAEHLFHCGLPVVLAGDFNSCRQATSGFDSASHSSSRGRRPLTPLTLKVAIFMNQRLATAPVATCARNARSLALSRRSFARPTRTISFWPLDIDSSAGSTYS